MHVNIEFNLVVPEFWVTKVFDTWLAMYVESATDDEMCIYRRVVKHYF